MRCDNSAHIFQEAEHTLAHEMGHNFGASHDGADKCDGDFSLVSKGYLMAPVAPLTDTRRARTFSQCSMKAIRKVRTEQSRA